jgi:hypothetical protein
MSSPRFGSLSVKIVNPSHCLNITYHPKIPLSGDPVSILCLMISRVVDVRLKPISSMACAHFLHEWRVNPRMLIKASVSVIVGVGLDFAFLSPSSRCLNRYSQ